MQAILLIFHKTLARIGQKNMYRRSEKQIEFEEFKLKFRI